MCVIIERNAQVTIPPEKLVSACHVNQDGYGLVIADRGKLEVFKDMPNGGNTKAIDTILKRLEDARDQKVLLHLRFSTAGKTDTENCHPFTALKEKGIEVQFMHNGTLSDFKVGGDHSDTYVFNNRVLGPLLHRCLAFSGEKGVLTDPFLAEVLGKYAGTASVFTLMDNDGQVLKINQTRGKQFNGWWASNEYSFDRYHRETGTYGGKGGYYYKGEYHTLSDTSLYGQHGTGAVAKIPPVVPKDDAKKPEEYKKIGEEIKKNNTRKIEFAELTERDTFCDLTGLDELSEIATLDAEAIEEIVTVYPRIATLLIQDLQYELYLRNNEEIKN